MFACIDGEEREIAPPSELALHPSNVVSVMMTFSVEVEVDRLHWDAERARMRASMREMRKSVGKIREVHKFDCSSTISQ
jgi:hypothetical protein